MQKEVKLKSVGDLLTELSKLSPDDIWKTSVHSVIVLHKDGSATRIYWDEARTTELGDCPDTIEYAPLASPSKIMLLCAWVIMRFSKVVSVSDYVLTALKATLRAILNFVMVKVPTVFVSGARVIRKLLASYQQDTGYSLEEISRRSGVSQVTLMSV